MSISASDVKELRETTGCGMMDCKKALTEAEGNMEKAVELLREKGLAAAAKKAGRIAAEGLVYAYENDAKNIGVVIEVNSETDFVAKNADFQAFVLKLATIVANSNPADVEALQAMMYDDKFTVDEMLKEKIHTIGENMNIRRFARYEGPIATYVHAGGKIGVMVATEGAELNDDNYLVARDVAMQIAAINPLYLDKTAVPAEDVEKEKEIIVAQIKNDPKSANKPDNIIDKMVVGRISKFYEQSCLMQQAFVKDDSLTVEKYLKSKGLNITKFVRFERGEGIEKREDNFADEVASMTK